MRLLSALAITFCACVGDIAPPRPPPAAPITPFAAPPERPSGFTVPEQPVQLLPFQVRFARLQAVTGAPASDPMFQKLLDARTSLGDYDFAAGIKPDNSWTALRITQWVTALKPICASPQMQQRYPDLPTGLAPLIEASYGRAATAADMAAVDDAMGGLTLSAAERNDGICLSVLSSMEFIAL